MYYLYWIDLDEKSLKQNVMVIKDKCFSCQIDWIDRRFIFSLFTER